jgi:hypothetical protein
VRREHSGSLLAGEEVLMIGGAEKGRQVMVEPPGDARRGAVLEIDDGVFVAGKVALVKERAGAVDESLICVGDLAAEAGSDDLAIESREERRGTGSIEALVVVKNANLQIPLPAQTILSNASD